MSYLQTKKFIGRECVVTKKQRDSDYYEYIQVQKRYLKMKSERKFEDDDWELDASKVCKITDPDCESCQ